MMVTDRKDMMVTDKLDMMVTDWRGMKGIWK
jgi:hypothetical protein